MEKDPSNGRVGENTLEQINDFLSRREFVSGAFAITGSVFLQGIGAVIAKKESRDEGSIRTAHEAHSEILFDKNACAPQNVCEISPTTVPETPVTTTTAVPPPTTSTTTTLAPPPETIPPPPPPELKSAETIRRPYEYLLENEEAIFTHFPSLEDLSINFGSSKNLYGHLERQLEHISMLGSAVQLDAEEFRGFKIDMSLANTFLDKGTTPIKAVLWHWTARPVDVHSLANGLKAKGLGVQNYVHFDGTAYQLTPTNSHYQDHALGLSSFTAGIEIYSSDDLGDNIPLLSYTPEAVKSALYVAAHIMEEVGLEANRKTLLSHHFADLVLVNPYYDPTTGVFNPIEGHSPPSIRKHDAVQNLMDMLLPKLQTLQTELRAKE